MPRTPRRLRRRAARPAADLPLRSALVLSTVVFLSACTGADPGATAVGTQVAPERAGPADGAAGAPVAGPPVGS